MDLRLKGKRALVCGASAGLGAAEEFAAVVAFLASEQAGYVTGASIPVVGGLHRGCCRIW